MINRKSIFISGGAGVIGKELIKKLEGSGYSISTGDLKNKPREFSNEIHYRHGDLNDISLRELEEINPDIFIHLAASFERSIESYSFLNENFINNVRLSHHLLSLIKNLPKVNQIIFASSYLVYDSSQYLFPNMLEKPIEIDEKFPLYPRNLTGSAKLMHEVELNFIHKLSQRDISVVIARIFRGYGLNSRDIISRWVRELINGKEISVYNPESMFDFIYSEDTAEAIKRLVQSENVSGIFNLGSGSSRSISNVLDILKYHFPDMQTIHYASTEYLEASQAVISNLSKSINWRPIYSLEEAIPKIITFEKERNVNI